MYTYAHQQLLNIDITHDLEVNQTTLKRTIISKLELLRNFEQLHHYIVFIHLNEVLAKQLLMIKNTKQQVVLLVVIIQAQQVL